MECKDINEKIYDYIEQQLSEEEMIKFEKHMVNCKSCQENYYRTEKIMIKLKNIEDIEPPIYLKHNILKKVREEKNVLKILRFKKYSYVAIFIFSVIVTSYSLGISNRVKDGTYDINYFDLKSKNDFSLNDNLYNSKIINDGHYVLEKEIRKEDKLNLFKYEILLHKDKVLKIYFENRSNHNVNLYVNDTKGNKIYKDFIISKNKNHRVELYTGKDIENDLYTINIEGDNIEGYVKIEITEK